ncbi:chromosome segregation protein SMC [Waterburya agarophytonicola K14]|uniref:Chromosome partition protein Smc n=1 Tax=Waterburya agarophytonicola KI4 TaxID=2874699 RepID=A0A964BPS8_9CYAN|nr:chromosome segregation protein SMC [Waterburya agarophytonicola]MCC0175685.1 chromosome segregation protein SMC [Waterburya agarophytonicola KI4]
MVHIKRVELSHFKSFGGTTKVPILPGFTVISGPNGSGKSNILDALLFCLGLASSKGMRADRLPDLVNNKHIGNGKAAETIVSVTLDLTDLGDLSDVVTTISDVKDLTPISSSEELQAVMGGNGNGNANGNGNGNGNGSHDSTQELEEIATVDSDDKKIIAIANGNSLEWKVTRRLRVGKKGNYTSTFYINGQVSTATEVHEQLQKLRIYPEGYNVVLQGDVTSIITMNSKERREIIDELAGVGAFDRKIEQTRKTLDKVQEREEKCHIIAQELIANRDRLAADRVKAEKYRKLKEKVQEKKIQEKVLVWRSLTQQQEELQEKVSAGELEKVKLTDNIAKLDLEVRECSEKLETLNAQVKALGEEEQLSVASDLATQKAKQHQLQQKLEELGSSSHQKQLALVQTQQNLEQYQQQIEQFSREKNLLETETIPALTQQALSARETLSNSKENANAIAEASEAWVQEQANLSRQVTAIQTTLNPQRTEQARISEKHNQLDRSIGEQNQSLSAVEAELTAKQNEYDALSGIVTTEQARVQEIASQLAAAESDRSLQEETKQRLLKEQRDKQRELDKLEAKKQAQQEVQGTYASKIILNSHISGVEGLVVQLGEVEQRYRLALETAAGGRLGFIVVESDRVAAEGIELLKRERGGRATFLPLNKIQAPRIGNIATMRFGRGFIDLAVNLVACDSRYDEIFAYVFGNTAVFDNLNNARSSLGKHRIVTLEGEILEVSGAMTGGSKSSRSSLHFGGADNGESSQVEALRARLAEITRILTNYDDRLSDRLTQIKDLAEELTEARQLGRDNKMLSEQLAKEIKRLTAQRELLINQLHHNRQERETIQARLTELDRSIPEQETQLYSLQEQLKVLEESHQESEWQQVQAVINSQEEHLQIQELNLRNSETLLLDVTNRYQRLTEKNTETQEYRTQLLIDCSTVEEQQSVINQQLIEIKQKIVAAEIELEQLTAKLGVTKEERDRLENELKQLREKHQKQSWQLEKLNSTQQERQETLQTLSQQIGEQEQELPNPIPDIPQLVNEDEIEVGELLTFANLQEQVEQLQKQIRNGEKRLEAMEPVNMLALEEYEKTEARLQELSQKLDTIELERTELLLRVEKFTTLRLRAFKESFDAVNENFQKIYAELSDGDGHLQLEDETDPFNGGLNLVAHPKGKAVQKLSSMSGGEKSLTALGFIFSLQKYRPSPFYAFDEVDMFLDGANVEKLSRMVKKQAQSAQFIVVSLRRPMIEASERTIGVTQARGAHTQVLGIKMK